MDEDVQALGTRYLCTSPALVRYAMLQVCRVIIGNLIGFPALAGCNPGTEAHFGQAQRDGQASKQIANASRKVI